MFAPRTESAPPENSEGVGTVVLVPTRFVWPYGGRRVFLTGSFTRWTEHLPMSPVEGCPTVFQAICNLTPGFHQYKFYVDGEWRHDERQPYVTGNYGMVNTILLAGDPIPAILSPQTPGSRSHMDVDNYAFQRVIRVLYWIRLGTPSGNLGFSSSMNEDSKSGLESGPGAHLDLDLDLDSDPYQEDTFCEVTLSDGTLQEAVPRISEADIEISRHRISVFLSSHTAYELLPESGKVIALDVNLPVKQAFHILYEQGIPVAPLWDSYKGQFVGVLSALDFILILRELGNHGSNLTEEELETHTILAWKEGKSQFNRQFDDHARQFQRRLIQAGPFDSLKDAALKFLQNGVSTVPIIHSSSQDGSFPQLLHLASLSGILKCICRHFRHCSSSLPILQQPISTIPLGTWVPKIGESNGRPLAMLRPNASLSSALSLLVQAQVSSIPIVDDNDSLLDIYSRSDITALAKDRVYAQVHLDEMSIHQALQLGQDAASPYGFLNGQRCQMCLPSDSLQKVMERLANPGVRRLVIVEAGSKRVEGIISLSDIFRFLLC